MPFLLDEFDGSESVATMSAEAEALYQRMLRRQWKYGDLPADPKALRALFPAKFAERFDATLAEVLPCFENRDGRLVNATCERVRLEQDSKAERARVGAEKTNAKRWTAGSETQSDAKAVAQRSHSDSPATRERSPSESQSQKENQTPQSPPQAVDGGSDSASRRRTRPDPVDPDALLADPANADLAPCAGALRDWARRLGRKFDDAGARALAAKARELGAERFAAAVRHSIASGYVGLVEPGGGLKAPPGPAATADPVSNDAAKRERAASTKRVLDALWSSGKAPRGVVVDADTATWAYLTWQAISSGLDPNDLPQADRDRIREWARKLVEAQQASGGKPGRAA
ncbi:MAG: DUF1376 domain-containing protein [Planctomycetes bacterium]|nr:DUF1376 domain-containing protein [Planctomycetota bacterium]